MTLKKPPRKHVAAKKKANTKIEALITFVSENGVIAVEDVVEEEEEAMITIVDHPEIQDPHHPDVEALQTVSTIEVRPKGARQTPTYQEDEEGAIQMTADVAHPLSLALHLGHALDLSLHQGVEETIETRGNDADTLQADLRRLFVEGQEMAGYAELQVGVMIVQDPLHFQKPLAHVLLEDAVQRDVRLPSHLAVGHHHPDAVDAYLRHLFQGHVLVH